MRLGAGRYILKQAAFAALVALTALGLAGCGGGPKVAARVNKETISEQEFQDRLSHVNAIELNESWQGGGPTNAGEYAMRTLLFEKIVAILASEKGCAPSAAQITQHMTFLNFMRKYPQEASRFGWNPLFSEADQRRSLQSLLAFRNLELKPLNLKDTDLTAEYEKRKGSLREPDEAHLRVIFMRNPAKAVGALDSLSKGVSFETVALRESEDASSRQRSGDVGFQPIPRMPAPVQAAIKTLAPGRWTTTPVKVDPPRNAGGRSLPTTYWIIQMVERKPGVAPPLETLRPLIEAILLDQKDPGSRARVEEELRSYALKADIEVKLKEYEGVPAKLKEAAKAPAGGGAPGPSGVGGAGGGAPIGGAPAGGAVSPTGQ